MIISKNAANVVTPLDAVSPSFADEFETFELLRKHHKSSHLKIRVFYLDAANAKQRLDMEPKIRVVTMGALAKFAADKLGLAGDYALAQTVSRKKVFPPATQTVWDAFATDGTVPKQRDCHLVKLI